MSETVPSREEIADFIQLLRRYAGVARRAFERDRVRGQGWADNPYVALCAIEDEVAKRINGLDFLCPFGWPQRIAENFRKLRDPRLRLFYHCSLYVDKSSGNFDVVRAEAKLDELDHVIEEIATSLEETVAAQAQKVESERQPRGANVSQGTNPYCKFEGFGQLLLSLESSERAYKSNIQQAERTEAKHGTIVAFHTRLQAEILRFRPDPTLMPGVDRIEALVNEEWGTPLTTESVRRLRGRLCRILKKSIEEIDALSMVAAAECLERQLDGDEDVEGAPFAKATQVDDLVKEKAKGKNNTPPEEKNRLVLDHLAKHPDATSAEIEKATGIPEQTVRRQPAWKTRQSKKQDKSPLRRNARRDARQGSRPCRDCRAR
jgi:hypothetical protein